MIHHDATSTAGRTPLVELRRLGAGLPGRILAKLDMRNPCGSVKDRLGLALIEAAEKSGRLKPGMTLVEPTGGNTGIGLAWVAAVRGYRLVLTMPENMSRERVALLQFLGAEVELTPGMLMGPAMERARQLAAERADCLMLDQFSNPANPALHMATTGVEIWEDSGGSVDIFISAVGTGGTITGVGRALRREKPEVRLVAVEPSGAALLSGGKPGPHSMPGIGVGFIPDVLDRSLIDEVIPVEDGDAFESSRRLARTEGILAGVSSGAALSAALEVASRPESAGKTIVVFMADSAERYITTDLFQQGKD
jgi:cysteine synthase A